MAEDTSPDVTGGPQANHQEAAPEAPATEVDVGGTLSLLARTPGERAVPNVTRAWG